MAKQRLTKLKTGHYQKYHKNDNFLALPLIIINSSEILHQLPDHYIISSGLLNVTQPSMD